MKTLNSQQIIEFGEFLIFVYVLKCYEHDFGLCSEIVVINPNWWRICQNTPSYFIKPYRLFEPQYEFLPKLKYCAEGGVLVLLGKSRVLTV